ncbi:DJ-1/PfpI family protein [Candidatus Gracilibacteria bacterium]|nr:DJ-1/PfpI family protein [Candidatus Gracilibacteria bacterium]
MKSILMILAPSDFRDEEYLHPRKVWEDAGWEVRTASSSEHSVGRFGEQVDNDFLLTQVETEEFDAIFFVGGGGCLQYSENATAKKLAKKFLSDAKLVGAICAAPRLFLKWGILSGKNFTGWNGDNALEGLGNVAGAHYTGEEVTIDGLIVTGDGPESAEKMGKIFMKGVK